MVAPRNRLSDVRGFIGELYGHDLHAKRVEAPSSATMAWWPACTASLRWIMSACVSLKESQIRGHPLPQALCRTL